MLKVLTALGQRRQRFTDVQMLRELQPNAEEAEEDKYMSFNHMAQKVRAVSLCGSEPVDDDVC